MAYHYYIVDGTYPARMDDKSPSDADILRRDGTWHPTHSDVSTEGREVSEAEARAFWTS